MQAPSGLSSVRADHQSTLSVVLCSLLLFRNKWGLLAFSFLGLTSQPAHANSWSSHLTQYSTPTQGGNCPLLQEFLRYILYEWNLKVRTAYINVIGNIKVASAMISSFINNKRLI